MNLNRIINDQRLIDVNIFIDQSVSFTGVCLKANKNIWLLVNYDYSKKIYNGYTIFRNDIIETYTLWKKSAVILKVNNLAEYSKARSFSNIKTLYSGLKWANNFGLIAIFTEKNTQSYFVGKILFLDRRCVEVQLVDNKGNWSVSKVLELKKIHFISFYSDYEKKISKDLNKKCISLRMGQDIKPPKEALEEYNNWKKE